jgi:hypothetical protein
MRDQLQVIGALRIILFVSYAREAVRSWSDRGIIFGTPLTKTGKEWTKEICVTIDT